MMELEATRTIAEQLGASSEFITRLHSILQALQALEVSVTTTLDFLGPVSAEIQRHIDQGTI